MKVVRKLNHKGKKAFHLAQAAQNTTPPEETVVRAVTLELGSPVHSLRVSVSRPPTVTQCSALLRPPAEAQMMRGGASLFPEEVGVHVGITMCEKSPAEAARTYAKR